MMNSTLQTELLNTTVPNFQGWDINHWNQYVFRMHLIPAFIYIFILLFFGIPGNALVCYVYHFKVRNKQLSSNIFILALSWFDLVNCTLTLPFELAVIHKYVNFDHPIMCKLARFIAFFCNNATSVILLAIASDRLRVFLSGPKNRRVTVRTSRIIILIAMVISAAVSWPMLVLFGTFKIPFENGVVGSMCSISNFYADQKTYEKVFTISLLCLHFAFDIAFIMIYSILGKKICYDTESNRRMSSCSLTQYSINRVNRKGSDTSIDDDVFGTQISERSRSFPVNENNNLLQENDQSSEVCFKDGHTSKSLPSRFGIVKYSDSFRGSFRTNFRSKQARSSSTLSEWRIFTSRQTISRTSFMLFIVTIAYMITYLPYCILVVIRTIDPGYYFRLNDNNKSLYQFFIRSYCLGSAINPLIYSFISSSFRKKCKNAISDIFSCKTRNSPTGF